MVGGLRGGGGGGGEIGGNCDWCNCVDSNTEPAAQHSCFGFGCGNVDSIYFL